MVLIAILFGPFFLPLDQWSKSVEISVGSVSLIKKSVLTIFLAIKTFVDFKSHEWLHKTDK